MGANPTQAPVVLCLSVEQESPPFAFRRFFTPGKFTVGLGLDNLSASVNSQRLAVHRDDFVACAGEFAGTAALPLACPRNGIGAVATKYTS
jgi:hypothetical protein